MNEAAKVLKKEWRKSQEAVVAHVRSLLARKLNSELGNDVGELQVLRDLARRECELNAAWRQYDVLR